MAVQVQQSRTSKSEEVNRTIAAQIVVENADASRNVLRARVEHPQTRLLLRHCCSEIEFRHEDGQ